MGVRPRAKVRSFGFVDIFHYFTLSSFYLLASCNVKCGSNSRCVNDLVSAASTCECIPEFWSPTNDGSKCIRKFIPSTSFFIVLYFIWYNCVSERPLPLGSFSWALDWQQVPKSNSENDLLIAKLSARSPRPLKFSLVNLDGEGPISLSDYVKDNGLYVKNTIQRCFATNDKMFGNVLVSDDREFCLETNTPGPCSTIISYSIELAQLNPSCPANIFRFSQRPTTIDWIPPVLMSRDERSLILSSSHENTHIFELGTTEVAYIDSHNDLQTLETQIKCSFNVRFALFSLFFFLLIRNPFAIFG